MKTEKISGILSSINLLVTILAALLMTVYMPVTSAQAVRNKSDFNHMKTGFPLTGVHTNVECETCHVGGVFKGTPTSCAGCHSAGRRIAAPFKPANHLITNEPCETCHTNTVSFLGARFNHVGVLPGKCMTCHNGIMGPGKPVGHVLTTAACDSCHRSSSWIPAGYDHAGKAIGDHSCPTCHGVTAIGKPAFHITTTAPCDSCHHNFTTFFGAVFDHMNAGVPITSGCVNCHGGQSLETKAKTSGVHIPTNASCENCHSISIFTSFAGASATMNHAIEAAARCDTCHNGSYVSQGSKLGGAKAKTSVGNHIPVTTECGICHTGFTSFTTPLASNTTQHTLGMPGIPCRTCHASGTNFLGVTGDKQAVSHKNADVGITGVDCSQSQCHMPTGSIGTSYTRWTN